MDVDTQTNLVETLDNNNVEQGQEPVDAVKGNTGENDVELSLSLPTNAYQDNIPHPATPSLPRTAPRSPDLTRQPPADAPPWRSRRCLRLTSQTPKVETNAQMQRRWVLNEQARHHGMPPLVDGIYHVSDSSTVLHLALSSTPRLQPVLDIGAPKSAVGIKYARKIALLSG